MNKFLNLLRKEIKELVTFQLIISLIFTILLFNFMGSITKSEIKKAVETRNIYVLDLDKSEISRELLSNLSLANFKVKLLNEVLSKEDKDLAFDFARREKINFFILIPENFGSLVSRFKPVEIEIYSFIRSFSLGSNVGSAVLDQVINAMNRYMSDQFIRAKFPGIDPDNLKNPIKKKEFVIVKDRIAEGTTSEVLNSVYSQSIFIPIILMIVIMYTSQMVLSAIAMEKQDKTLETLLTVPIGRKHIVIAKMMGAGIVGIISSLIYMYGYRSFMGGISGNVDVSSTSDIIQKLGVSFTPYGYTLFGISLFLAILCGLALSTILGVLAEDLKSAQSMSLPLVFLVIVPYFVSLFSDINNLSLPVRLIIMAIPFSHPFIASREILLGNYNIVFFGILYMVVVFIALIVIAAKIFSTDRILTMKIGFLRRKSS
uniref:ABC transporter permease n=1 Tax=Dictyoglomus thermophilum TaxID=14 RepID=A0A7C3RQX4_DICTH